jgi:hypothetical protein
MNITTTHNAPPTIGEHSIVWEGYACADEILPGDIIVPDSVVSFAVRQAGDIVLVTTDGSEMDYAPDESLLIQRRLRVTVAPAD